MTERPERKRNRLQLWDYSHPGAYFVTVCTKDRRKLLGKIVGEGLCALPRMVLSPIGSRVRESIEHVSQRYDNVRIDKYIVMPNHIHLIVRIEETGGHRGPPLHKIIGQMKSYTTHSNDGVLWQRSFHDHIIRGEKDYRRIWEYIDTNTLKWTSDCFYVP